MYSRVPRLVEALRHSQGAVETLDLSFNRITGGDARSRRPSTSAEKN